ncbi:MAG: 2-nitropropane dioxygenase [Clostridiales bacterium 38_11]|nr:MAG: 2-nitropropane dioxygenase [Clostridiales bacterium 38_11]HBH13030.1 enoyl-[acyl-carrier-protein] reductase FabK [Clostridiales bacterium]
MQTRLTKLLDIQYPIIQGGMAAITDAVIASAVSNAGGAGIIGSGGHDAKWVKEQIALARQLTDKTFGVNIVLAAENKDEIIEVVCEERPTFVTFGAGNPIPYIERLKNLGIITIPVVANLKQAKNVEAAGVDALVTEGMEAGGHIGRQTTLSLLTNVIPTIQIPVIAAGGIADQRGFKAAIAMGAEGVQIGSAFLISEECPAHINVKKKIIESTDMDSVVLGYTIRHDVRGIRNRFTDDYLALEYSDAPREALKGKMKGVYNKAFLDGDVENGYIEVGQSLNALTEILPCEQIIQKLVKRI